ncbi:hypothetical protein DWUX_2628 [Desulfovibrio diazotrophicus]|jgi:hypothetical protein|nr:hypothetical protein DWUX_2628 [Desulfovibrio diazotrophicus]
MAVPGQKKSPLEPTGVEKNGLKAAKSGRPEARSPPGRGLPGMGVAVFMGKM